MLYNKTNKTNNNIDIQNTLKQKYKSYDNNNIKKKKQ